MVQYTVILKHNTRLYKHFKALHYKMTPAMQAESKGSDGSQPRQQAAAPTKKQGRGGFDDHPVPDDGMQARPSHGGWLPLLPPVVLAGHKRAAASSQSPKKVDAKVARQVQVQHRLSQQALQPALACIFLLSAPVGAPRPFEMTKRSVAMGNNKRERLSQETSDGQALFTQFGGIAGMTRAVLMQPAQPSGVNEPQVLQIQEDELRVCNAGVSLSDQA